MQGVGVGFLVGAGSHAEEAVLRVDGIQTAVVANVHPGDIVAHRPHLVALLGIHFGRDEHGQVGFAAGRGERGGDVVHVALRILDAEDQHVLGHPAFLVALVAGDAQREAFFAQQHVSAVAGVDGPDGVVLGELDDVAVLRVDVRTGMLAAHEIVGIAQLTQGLHTHAGHDIHVQHNVDGVGHFNADLGERAADGAHAVRNNVHGAARHHIFVQGQQLGLHFVGVHPVDHHAVVRLVGGADERAVLHAGHVVFRGMVQHAAGQLLLVQLRQLARGERLLTQGAQLAFRTVDPDGFVRGHELFHLFDPVQNMLVACQCHNQITFL